MSGEGWEVFAFDVMFRRTFDVIWSRGFFIRPLWRIVRVVLDWSGGWPCFFSFGLYFLALSVLVRCVLPYAVRTCVNFLQGLDRNLLLWYLELVA